MSPLVMACRMCQVIDKINLTKNIGGLFGDDIPLAQAWAQTQRDPVTPRLSSEKALLDWS